MDRLVDHLFKGIDIVRLFSGHDSVEHATHLIAIALYKSGIQKQGSKGFKVESACDSSATCQTVLKAFRNGMKTGHIFGDVLRLPQPI